MDVARACKRLRPEMSSKTEFESKENMFLRLSKFKSQMQRLQLKIIYSTRYSDTEFEYRHAFLPIELSKMIPSDHLLTESEWRNLGVQQSVGWEHYMLHNPEPHILLFRRKCPKTNRGRN